MLLSDKKDKSQSSPNIGTNTNIKGINANFKYLDNSRKRLNFFTKNILPNFNQTITIMDNIRNNSTIPKYYLNYRRNNPLFDYRTKKSLKDFEKIKIYKGKAMEIFEKYEQNKQNKKKINLSNEYNKRHVYLFQNDFNYSCGMDKNEIFCLRMNKKPRERKKQEAISLVNKQINIENYEFKLPRMVSILKRNDFLYNKILYQPWKYPFLFSK